MDYQQASQFAQTAGLVLLAVCFAIAVVYALWPGNKEKFKRAARTPLADDKDDAKAENGDDNG